MSGIGPSQSISYLTHVFCFTQTRRTCLAKFRLRQLQSLLLCLMAQYDSQGFFVFSYKPRLPSLVINNNYGRGSYLECLFVHLSPYGSSPFLFLYFKCLICFLEIILFTPCWSPLQATPNSNYIKKTIMSSFKK